jgi:hypothetical protein
VSATTLRRIRITFNEHDRPVIDVDYGEGGGGADDGAATADPEEFLQALVANLTDRSAGFLTALIEANESDGFVTLAELAVRMKVEKREVDGWNRNFGRSVKKTVREYGFLRSDAEDGTAQLFDWQWDQDDNAWRYRIPDKYRPILLAALNDEE